MKMKMILATLTICLAALFVSLIDVMSKIALLSLTPQIYTCLCYLFASLVITPFLLARQHSLPRPSFGVLALSALITLNTVCFAYGVRLITATLTSLLFTTMPLLISVLSCWVTREPLRARSMSGIVVGGVGALLVVLPPTIGHASLLNSSLLGDLFIGAAVLTLAVYTLLSKSFQERYSPLYLTAVSCYATALITAVLAIPDWISLLDWWKETTPVTWMSTITAGLSVALFFLCYQYTVHYDSPLLASLYEYLAPLFTFGVAAWFLGESLSPGLVAGALLILLGLYLVTTSTQLH